jgi:hypothetical protein
MKRGTTSALVLALAIACLAVVGCGAPDDNPEAARLIAQSYLDGRHDGDVVTVCRLSAPEVALAAAAQAGGSCERFMRRALMTRPASLRAGPTLSYAVDGVYANARVAIQGRAAGVVTLRRYASFWRVVSLSSP